MLNFEWDNAKAAGNFRKHGVTFEQAAYAFRDPFGIEWIDERADYGEERVILLGMSGGQILSVAYTERHDCIRIISARRATKYEKETYYRQKAT
ncbi:MAG: BrnT family toxin [Desulfobaccales bacterium]